MFKKAILLITIVVSVIAAWTGLASACGGFFCQATPVDQTGERIVFTQNNDGTITTLIEIMYVGAAEDFSWILPIPTAIDASALQVPTNGNLIFDELHDHTDVEFIAPPNRCFDLQFGGTVSSNFSNINSELNVSAAPTVEVFDSGEVGPFGFDIIGSTDRGALVDWLRDNNYQVTAEMLPLIDIYVDQNMAFIAMRLLDGQTADSIAPIEITYPGTEPTIPLQLTAVAARRQMPIWVWLFGEERANPTNFEQMEIATQEITFFERGGNDYIFLVQDRADALGGHAFITEFADRVGTGGFNHEWLEETVEDAPYLTRLTTYLDPEEMTVDPTFTFDGEGGDVSNIRNASTLRGLYDCERDSYGTLKSVVFGPSDAIDPTGGSGGVDATTPSTISPRLILGAFLVLSGIVAWAYSSGREEQTSIVVTASPAQ